MKNWTEILSPQEGQVFSVADIQAEIDKLEQKLADAEKTGVKLQEERKLAQRALIAANNSKNRKALENAQDADEMQVEFIAGISDILPELNAALETARRVESSEDIKRLDAEIAALDAEQAKIDGRALQALADLQTLFYTGNGVDPGLIESLYIKSWLNTTRQRDALRAMNTEKLATITPLAAARKRLIAEKLQIEQSLERI